MKNILKRNVSTLMICALNLVAIGASARCCYFVFHQPKVPASLKEFAKNQK